MAKEYNEALRDKLLEGMTVLRAFVMDHTIEMCQKDPYLSEKVKKTIEGTRIYYADEDLSLDPDGPTTDISIYNRRTLDALPLAKGKVAALNFANAFRAGGSPWTAGAQEECLCRCSTLYPCINAFNKEFYGKHLTEDHLDALGTDDMIYSPGVIKFKTDQNVPLLLEQKDYGEVDIITCAAPDLRFGQVNAQELATALYHRIERIILAAKRQGAETLILGAFGCGVFSNPPQLVARCFKKALEKYRIEKVIFAIIDSDIRLINAEAFQKVFGIEIQA